MKNKVVPIILSSLLLGGLVLTINQNNKDAVKVDAYEDISIQSGGDAFRLIDKQYGAKESFVYTGDLHFRSGQAGGLAFGSQQDDHYYVVNMDRYENHVKLMHFSTSGVDVLKEDYFIGNDKLTDSERDIIGPQIREIENVNLKVILTVEEDEDKEKLPHAYVEFYVEGIKRFGVDTTIDLNYLDKPYHYEGGYLGANCFNGDIYVTNIEIGKSDYSYFSEPYRNQYHLQPFAKWTNDPNALCYYNGWYHIFYQTHPFNNYWGFMYWGHARSRDLIHFEFLPLCLFPDNGANGYGSAGTGWMWSGCAITYKMGMSHDIDLLNWFPNGNGNGMLAIFTRDGDYQDQVMISSDDEGLTWSKRQIVVSQGIIGMSGKQDFRDPKVFPLIKNSEGTVQMWGMTLSSYALDKGWFLKSPNLIDWQLAGSFAFPHPECIGVGVLKDENGQEHAYLTNKSRSYILGTMSYNTTSGKVEFLDESGKNIEEYTLEQMPLEPLDFGPDSYASQSFFINDPASEFYGKDIVLNWFSGDLNASYCTGPGEYANLRGRWNGGFTMPVEYGVKNTTEGLRLTQKPISVNNVNLAKENIVTINDQDIDSSSENPLKDVHTHIFELSASITVENNSPINFKVDVGEDEYMQFGWNAIDGYYVDRTYLDDKDINVNVDWHTKYASHILGDSDTKTFYVLSDNGGLEVFCEDFSIPFYFVTTASMYSTRASLRADSATINHLELNEVSSVYRHDVSPDEGVLYVSSNEVTLDTQLTSSKFVTCWYSGQSELEWEEVENDGVVDYTATNQGINIVAKKTGTASFKVKADDKEEVINVTVGAGYFISDFTFTKENVVSGTWMMDGDTLVGEKESGNGFILAEETASDFALTAQFDIVSGTAASVVFRASSDLSSYIVANYDAGEKVVKLWSTHGELTRSEHKDIPLTNIGLTVKAKGKNVTVSLNGDDVIQYTLHDDEPLSGQIGLNVFSARAVFKGLSMIKENYEYASGELTINLQVEQYVKEVYNLTKGNTKLDPGFYYQSGKSLFIKESYFALLENGVYQFKVVGSSSTFYITIEVEATPDLLIEDMTVEAGVNVNVYIGNTVVTSLKINDTLVDAENYSVKDYVLTINSSCFSEGDNTVIINDTITFNVKIEDKQDSVPVNPGTNDSNNLPLILGLSIGGGVLLLGGAVVATILIISKKKRKSA